MLHLEQSHILSSSPLTCWRVGVRSQLTAHVCQIAIVNASAGYQASQDCGLRVTRMPCFCRWQKEQHSASSQTSPAIFKTSWRLRSTSRQHWMSCKRGRRPARNNGSSDRYAGIFERRFCSACGLLFALRFPHHSDHMRIQTQQGMTLSCRGPDILVRAGSPCQAHHPAGAQERCSSFMDVTAEQQPICAFLKVWSSGLCISVGSNGRQE